MLKFKILNICSLLLCITSLSSVYAETVKENKLELQETQSTNVDANKESILSMLWGKKSENKLYLGMFTLHVNPSSFKRDNWNQQLIGIQYNGFSAFTLVNSFYNRTYMIGVSRTILTKEYTNWDINLGYHLGLIYGYKPRQAPFSSLSPIIPGPIPFVSTTYKKRFGVEFELVPDPAISFFLRF